MVMFVRSVYNDWKLSGFINLIGKMIMVMNGQNTTQNSGLGDTNIPGCTDSTAYNFDASANTDDGSCIATVNGCADSSLLIIFFCQY